MKKYLKEYWNRWLPDRNGKACYLFYSKGSYYKITMTYAIVDDNDGWLAKIVYLGIDPRNECYTYIGESFFIREAYYSKGEEHDELVNRVMEYIHREFKPSSPWKRY